MKYIKRIVDKEIKEKLSISGAVVIKGPKWCGKTTSAKQVAKSVLEMQNPDLQENYIELANTRPSLLLEGEKPRLIDEWQIVPKLWNAVRYSVDNIGKTNQYILIGSATPKEDDTMHSGVGRFSFITRISKTRFTAVKQYTAVNPLKTCIHYKTKRISAQLNGSNVTLFSSMVIPEYCSKGTGLQCTVSA